MADFERSLSLLGEVVRTDEDREAFDAGYDSARDPANKVRFSGAFGSPRESGLLVTMEDREENDWTRERYLPRSIGVVLVYEPAFVLGALCATFERQWAPEVDGARTQ